MKVYTNVLFVYCSIVFNEVRFATTLIKNRVHKTRTYIICIFFENVNISVYKRQRNFLQIFV